MFADFTQLIWESCQFWKSVVTESVPMAGRTMRNPYKQRKNEIIKLSASGFMGWKKKKYIQVI